MDIRLHISLSLKAWPVLDQLLQTSWIQWSSIWSFSYWNRSHISSNSKQWSNPTRLCIIFELQFPDCMIICDSHLDLLFPNLAHRCVGWVRLHYNGARFYTASKPNTTEVDRRLKHNGCRNRVPKHVQVVHLHSGRTKKNQNLFALHNNKRNQVRQLDRLVWVECFALPWLFVYSPSK